LREFLETFTETTAARPDQVMLNSSYIFMMDLMLPRKKEVLDYLNGVKDDVIRSARVILFRGDKAPPVVEEWNCGPLPKVFSCKLLKELETKTRNPLDFSLRPFSMMELSPDRGFKDLLMRLDSEIGTILKESYNASFTDCNVLNDCLKYTVKPVISNDSTNRELWITPTYNVPFHSLHPLGMSILCQVNGVDPTQWNFSKIWYFDQIFNSLADFQQAYLNNTLTKIKLTKPVHTHDSFSTLHRRGDPQPLNPERPPTEVEPDGKRYSLKSRKVTYFNWDFHFRMSTLSGPALYDVRFKGERIAYEIALSEMAVFYSGISPWAQGNFVTSGSLVGLQQRSLVPGADCPETATLINQTVFNPDGDSPVAKYVTFCIFEHNHGQPLRRHLSYPLTEGSFYDGMLDSALILRSAITIANYDYIIDFIFHQNGALETKATITGYLQAGYYFNAEKQYGFRIGETLFGNLHQHLFHFKVDLDINGTANRYQTLDIEPKSAAYSDEPDHIFFQNQLVRTLKKSELDAVHSFNFDQPKAHIVFNNFTRNSFKENKGYRIYIEGISKSLLSDDSDISLPWAAHQMVVTKQKDSEIRGSSVYAMFDSARAATNFTTFYSDNENIVDEDLVLWITCGSYHIPSSEDLPTTATVGASMGFYLLPFNYHDECPSMTSRDAILVRHADPSDAKRGIKVQRHNSRNKQCITRTSTLEHDLDLHPELLLEMNHKNSTS
ncbi:amine oxidase [copper-containing], partial [Biomphalaria pfeifferi]